MAEGRKGVAINVFWVLVAEEESSGEQNATMPVVVSVPVLVSWLRL